VKFILLCGTALAVLSTYSYSENVDYVKCKREKSSFRQFCYVDEIQKTKSISVARYAEVNGESLDLLPIYEESKIEIQSLNGGDNNTLTLSSLAPHIKADINWVHSKECLVSELWFDSVYISVSDGSTGDTRNLKPVNIGLNSYDISLNEFHVNSFDPWLVTSDNNTSVQISSSVFVHNTDHSGDRPLAHQRIPTYCKMDVDSLRVGFDALGMSGDLETLKIQADTTISLKTRAAVVHANLVDGQRGAACSVYTLGNNLFNLEFAWSWDDLSYESKDLISDGVKKAVELGAISQTSIPNGNDYFDYFKGDDFQNSTEILCAGTSPMDYAVSTDPFVDNGEITSHQGYNNAIVYSLAAGNFVEIIKAAWSINNVAVAEIEDYVQKEWLTSPIIINEF